MPREFNPIELMKRLQTKEPKPTTPASLGPEARELMELLSREASPLPQSRTIVPRAAGNIPLRDISGRVRELEGTAATLEANKDTPFVERMLEPDGAPTIPGPGGTTSSHLMAYGEADGKFYAYPTLVQSGDQLVEPQDPLGEALRTGNTIEFNTEQEAADFAAGAWKDVALQPRGQDFVPQMAPDIPLQDIEGRTGELELEDELNMLQKQGEAELPPPPAATNIGRQAQDVRAELFAELGLE